MCCKLFIITHLIVAFVNANDEISSKLNAESLYEVPQNITVETSSSTSIIVKWEPPVKEYQSGTITEYKIRYRIKGTHSRETISTDGNRRLYELSKLQKGVQYQIRVAAVYGNTSGPFSDWYLTETYSNDLDETQLPEAPSLLQAKAAGNSIHLTWLPPINQNVMIRGYTIGWGIGFPDLYTKVLDSKQRTYTIDENVLPSSEYVISLRAYNTMGEGKPIYETVKTPIATTSEPVTPIIPPVGLKAYVLSPHSIAVYWTDTTLTGTQVTDNRRYVVRYTNNLDSHSPKYSYCNTTQCCRCVVEALQANTQYEFAVKVIKGKRDSMYSMTAVNQTLEAPPSAPRDLTVVRSHTNDNSLVHAQWQPPKYPNGQITGYVIFYTSGDNSGNVENEWMYEAVVGDRMNTVIKGLLPDTKYYFKIRARNSKGEGPPSKETMFITPPAAVMRSTTGATSFFEKGWSTQSIYLIIVAVAAVAVLLIITISAVICRTTCNRSGGVRKHKGYTAAATSPGGKAKSSRDLKPPDLWIHHNEQIELKGLAKGHNADASLTATPIPRSSQEFSCNDDSKKSGGYSDGLYDDLNKGSISPSDTGMSLVSGSNTLRRTARTKPLMIPVDAQTTAIQTNSAISFEPSTGLSRPVYPRTQLNVNRAHVTLDPSEGSGSNQHHLYDPVAAPPMHMGLGGQSLTNGHLSTNVSYGSGNAVTSPTSNTLSKRIVGHSLKSFSVPSSTNTQSSHSQPKHAAVRPQMSTSPQKKTAPGNLMSNSYLGKSQSPRIGITDNLKREDDVVSTYSTEELNQEMANLEGLMKDLNALSASQFEITN